MDRVISRQTEPVKHRYKYRSRHMKRFVAGIGLRDFGDQESFTICSLSWGTRKARGSVQSRSKTQRIWGVGDGESKSKDPVIRRLWGAGVEVLV